MPGETPWSKPPHAPDAFTATIEWPVRIVTAPTPESLEDLADLVAGLIFDQLRVMREGSP